MKAKASNPALVKVDSHSVSTEFASSDDIAREELYPKLRVEWRGQEIAVEMRADRYVVSDAQYGKV